MLITGFRVHNEVEIPFTVDSTLIGYINPWRSSDCYRRDGKSRDWDNGQEIHINLNVNGKDFEIGGNDRVFINGVPVENDRTENAVKIIEYIQTIMALERKEPPMEIIKEMVKPKTKKTTKRLK